MSADPVHNLINPYLPDDVYIPDGEPHVYGHRVYLYGSHDINGTRFPCEGDYQCWSAPLDNLTDWRNEGVIYQRLQDPFIFNHQDDMCPFNKYLFAPDVVHVGDYWYLYYGVGMSGSGIGVAVANAPAGHFNYLGRVHYPDQRPLGHGRPLFTTPLGVPVFHKKGYPYDPAILYDDGRLFLYFGYGHCYVVELSTLDMRLIVQMPEVDGYVSADLLAHDHSPWRMQNAASIRKIKGRYYLTYYAKKDESNALCYATADNPLGPFHFQGVLVSLGNGGVFQNDEGTAYQGNTHGGLFEVNGRFFLNYHRQTGGKFPNRQACLTELTIDQDGHFQTAEFKSQVQAHGGLAWDHRYGAKSACVLVDPTGHCKKHSAPYFRLQKGRQVLARLKDGCLVGFKYLDFRGAGKRQRIRVEMTNAHRGSITVLIDDQQPVGKINVTAGKTAFVGMVTIPEGVHAVYFQFEGQRWAHLAGFQFSRPQ